MWNDITAFGQHKRSNDVGRGMPSSPLDNTHGRTTSGVACHHRIWATHTVERRRTWHAIIAFGKHTRSNDVGRGMPSLPLCSTNSRTTSSVACHIRLLTRSHSQTASGVTCHHRLWQHTWSNDIGCGITSPPFDSTNGRTTSGVACHHRVWIAHTVERRRA